jgi:hypothetical protein
MTFLPLNNNLLMNYHHAIDPQGSGETHEASKLDTVSAQLRMRFQCSKLCLPF